MAFPVVLNGRTYTLADFEGTNYVDGLPDAFEDFVTQAGDIYNDTSTSSVLIGTGSKTFTVSASKPYQAGTPLRIADAAAPSTNFLDCVVTSYSGTTLVVDALGFAGSGTIASWTINIGGAKTVDGTLAIAQGGTGATSAADARTNLDVYSKADADSKFLDVSGEASDVTMTGNVTIGDAGTDTLTVNAAANFTASFTVDTDTLVVDDTNNRVGIGTNNPGANLEIKDATSTLRFQSSANAGYAQVSGASGSLYLSADSGNTQASSAILFNVDAAEKMRLDSNGNLLVGETSASSKFAVRSSSSQTVTYSGTVYETACVFRSSSLASNLTFGSSETTGHSLIASQVNGAALVFGVRGGSTNSEAMRIDASGNVGIGTDTLADKLAVVGTISVQDSAGTVTDALKITASTTSSYQNTITHGDSGLEFDNNSTSRGYVWSVNGSQKVLIDSNGDLVQGTTGVGNSLNTGGIGLYKFNGSYGQLRIGRPSAETGTLAQLAFYHNGSYIGGLNTTASTTALVTSSDERLKENIVDAPAGVIDSIQVRSFDWKATGEHQAYGFIAQELDVVAPFATHYNEDEDAWGVDATALIPMLVKEIQDLKAEVEALKNA